jgi:hypothetical protein
VRGILNRTPLLREVRYPRLFGGFDVSACSARSNIRPASTDSSTLVGALSLASGGGGGRVRMGLPSAPGCLALYAAQQVGHRHSIPA